MESPIYPPGSRVPTNISLFKKTICDRKREIFPFRPSVLTYQLNLYHHKQIHTNPTLIVDRGRVSAAQMASLDPRLHLLQLIHHN